MVRLTIQGRARVAEDLEGETNTGRSVSNQEIKYNIEIEDSSRFHRLMCKRSAAKIAENCLPENHFVETKTYDDWDVWSDLNAVEATELAEEVAADSDQSVYDVLTLWLQTLGSMRVRRALHTRLSEEDVEVSRVD